MYYENGAGDDTLVMENCLLQNTQINKWTYPSDYERYFTISNTVSTKSGSKFTKAADAPKVTVGANYVVTGQDNDKGVWSGMWSWDTGLS